MHVLLVFSGVLALYRVADGAGLFCAGLVSLALRPAILSSLRDMRWGLSSGRFTPAHAAIVLSLLFTVIIISRSL